MKLKLVDKIFAATMITLFAASLVFLVLVLEFRNRPTVPVPDTPTTISEQDVYMLKVKCNKLEEDVKKLQQSHEMAIGVTQDMDERLSVVEGRKR